MKLEESLNGGYLGLYGEVVTEDCYRLRQLTFQPEVIFDVGANVGVFARHAREVFPGALIVSLEPDPVNCSIFREFTHDRRTVLIEKALGYGSIYHGLTARNGAGETYLSKGQLGYPGDQMEQDLSLELSTVQSIELWELVREYGLNGKTWMLKLDCEGAENTIWKSKRSMIAFRGMDYIAAEIHFYALNGAEQWGVRRKTLEAIHSLDNTHDWTLDNVHLWATRKEVKND